ncbi:MAG: PIN domain-containing protein [Candidatus Aenigmarchaeota archaeon]|nr:PIN domain-containing protein [Candidatus Aenigmarchaeota archaeon]
MTRFVVDSYAWVEYFKGSEKGRKAKDFLEGNIHEIYTNIVTLSEVISVTKRQGLDFVSAMEIVLGISQIYGIDIAFSKEAGELHADIKKEIKNIGLADIFVLLTARKLGAKILTGDPHFKNFKEAVMI